MSRVKELAPSVCFMLPFKFLKVGQKVRFETSSVTGRTRSPKQGMDIDRSPWSSSDQWSLDQVISQTLDELIINQ